ncbi:HMG-box, partial [Dendrothele bispora CBS 962.96]
YIPRPPNAFMLFRADFVRQKHVPGSVETNHGSLSKIIGSCWRSLPPKDKQHWEILARKEKQAHKERWPDYKFRPVHKK